MIGSPHFFVGRDDYFCPSLDIHHADGRFDVRFDETALADFLDTVFS